MNEKKINKYFMPYQRRAIYSNERMVLWEKSIRIGATYAMAFRAVRRRILGLGDYLHTSVNERNALSFVSQCKKFCEIFKVTAEEIDEFSAYNPLTDRQESAFQIVFPNKKSIKAFSSNPDALRGEGGEVGIDELSSHRDPDEMIKAAGGRAAWGQAMTIWSSHRGEAGTFNRKISEERAKGDKSQWIIWSTDLNEALDQGLLNKINEVRRAEAEAAGLEFTDITRKAFIEETIAMVGGQEAFDEECMLKPRKGGGAAITWNLLENAREDYSITRIHYKEACDVGEIILKLADSRDKRLAMGYDVARTGHLSSIWINTEESDKRWRLSTLITMAKTTFKAQKETVRALMRAFPTMIGAGDKTGLGMQVCEELETEFGAARFVGINFSATKPELGTKLVRVFEDGRQILPAAHKYDEIVYDIAGIRTDPTGPRVKFYESPNPVNKASHCDMAWSAALALFVGDDNSGAPGIVTL